MTLNMTVLTRTRIFQSSDFRITLPEGRILNDETMKLVTLHYPTFDGMVSYTGIATVEGDPRDTAQRVTEWLSGKPDLRFHEVVEEIRRGASDLVARAGANKDGNFRMLTLIAAAFVEQQPTIAVISNFESIERDWGRTDANLSVDWGTLRPADPPRVVVTGAKPAVDRDKRRYLVELAASAGEDSAQIRSGIRQVNWLAHRSRPDGSISEGCTVVSLDSSGGGLQDVTQTPGVRTWSVHNGSTWDLLTQLGGLDLSGATFMGAAFATSKPSTRGPVECSPRITDLGASKYRIVELVRTVDADCQGIAVSDEGLIVGTTSVPGNRTIHRYWTWSSQEGLRDLPFYTKGGGAALHASAGMTLTVLDQKGQSGAVVVQEDSTRQLEVPDGMGEVNITSINVNGCVSGSISVTLDNTVWDRQQPAFWDEGGALHILDDLQGGTNGRTESLNDQGLAVVLANRGFPFANRITVVWNTTSGHVTTIPGEVMPLFINASGHVLGVLVTEGNLLPAVSRDQRTWTKFNVNFGFSPAGANQSLATIGRVDIDGFAAPWLSTPEGPPLLLPTYEHHNVIPRSINGNGVIVGHASSDYEQHVLVWLPPTT